MALPVQIKILKTFKWPTDRPLLLNQFIQCNLNDILTIRPEILDSPGFCALVRNGVVQIIDAPEGTQCENGLGVAGTEVLTRADKEMVSFGTDNVTPYQPTGIVISSTPIGDGDVEVAVNGVTYSVCNGDRNQAKPFYFSGDVGLSARLIKDIVVGDFLFVNGAELGFGLAATDSIDLRYLIQINTLQTANILTLSDKNLVPLLTDTLSNGQTTGVTISQTPSADGDVEVYVNGISYSLGDGVLTKDFYFSADGGTTPRLIKDIVVGDTLYVNGIILNFGLDPLTDTIDLRYVMNV